MRGREREKERERVETGQDEGSDGSAADEETEKRNALLTGSETSGYCVHPTRGAATGKTEGETQEETDRQRESERDSDRQ